MLPLVHLTCSTTVSPHLCGPTARISKPATYQKFSMILNVYSAAHCKGSKLDSFHWRAKTITANASNLWYYIFPFIECSSYCQPIRSRYSNQAGYHQSCPAFRKFQIILNEYFMIYILRLVVHYSFKV